MTASNLAKLPVKPLKLIYFDTKGRGEPIRLILARKGIDFEDVRLSLDILDSLREGAGFSSNQSLIWIDEHGIELGDKKSNEKLISL